MHLDLGSTVIDHFALRSLTIAVENHLFIRNLPSRDYCDITLKKSSRNGLFETRSTSILRATPHSTC